MIWRRRIAAILFACLLPGAAAGQSVFGVNYLGEHRHRGNARQRSLGCSAIAVSDTVSAIGQNTAALADLRFITFSIYEALGMSSIGREGEESLGQSRFQLPSVMLAVPVRRGLVFGIGYRTRFEGRGDFGVTTEVPGVGPAQDLYTRRSSLFTVPLSAAWRPFDWLRVAGELQIERGSIFDEISAELREGSFEPAVSKRTRRFSGTSWSTSALARLHPRLWVGVSLDAGVSYEVEEEFAYSRSDLDSTGVYDFDLPPAWGAGAAVGVTGRWWLSASYWFREKPGAEGFPALEGHLEDERLLSFGVERRADPGAAGGLSRLPLRLGFRTGAWHLTYPLGEELTATFLTLGTGIRMPGGPGTIDLSLELGRIGSEQANGIDEQTVRIGIGINVSGRWTRRGRDRR